MRSAELLLQAVQLLVSTTSECPQQRFLFGVDCSQVSQPSDCATARNVLGGLSILRRLVCASERSSAFLVCFLPHAALLAHAFVRAAIRRWSMRSCAPILARHAAGRRWVAAVSSEAAGAGAITRKQAKLTWHS
eukprot:1099690-Pleurochrysis_carterae.AAC.3